MKTFPNNNRNTSTDNFLHETRIAMEITASNHSLTEIEALVRPHLKFLKKDAPLGPDQNLGEAGLDSMASIDLLLDLEDTFHISIEDELLTENSFATLAEIRKLIDASRR